MKEIWKDIKDYPNYKISNFGRIMRINKYTKNRITKQQLGRDGYLRCNLSKNGTNKKVMAHRLVAQAFIPNPKNKPQVNHIYPEKTFNHVFNLEWVDRHENMRHAYQNNLINTAKGDRHPMSKIKEDDLLIIFNLLDENIACSVIGKMFGVSRKTISNIKNGNTWRHIDRQSLSLKKKT